MNKKLAALSVVICIGLRFGHLSAQDRQPAVIQTIPPVESMRRTPPQPVTRAPSWADVEQRLQAYRDRRKQWGASYQILASYYNYLAGPQSTGVKNLEEHVAQLQKWREQMPSSYAARVVAAEALIEFAWEARGSGVALTVTEEGWKLFGERIAEAHRVLDEALQLGPQDGNVYALLAIIGYAEGHPRETVQAWVDAGMKLDPTYYDLYDRMAVYLMPRWMGEPGDIERFAADVASRLPGDNGLEAYARIALGIQRYECGWGETLFRGEYDPKMLVRAAEVLQRRNPESAIISHFAALCALTAQDHEAAKRIRPNVGPYKAEDKIWVWENSLKGFLEWSGAVENPKAEGSWVFAGVFGIPETGIAFGNDTRTVWVAQQFGNSAANLIHTRTRAVKLSVPSPGGVVNGFLYDAGRQWALVSAWNGPLTGWMLWDFSGALAPVRHETKEMCRGLAIHPTKPIVYWGEGQTVRAWNFQTDEAGPEFEINDVVHQIKLSPDGKLLAANHWICDPIEGKLKFRLGMSDAGAAKFYLVNFDSVLAVENDGHVWAVTREKLGADGKISLVRFEPDGKTWETLLEGIHASSGHLSPDRKLFVQARPLGHGKAACPIDVWNIAARKRVKEFGGHWSGIGQLRFSPDGKMLASSAGWDDAVKIWPLEGLAD